MEVSSAQVSTAEHFSLLGIKAGTSARTILSISWIKPHCCCGRSGQSGKWVLLFRSFQHSQNPAPFIFFEPSRISRHPCLCENFVKKVEREKKSSRYIASSAGSVRRRAPSDLYWWYICAVATYLLPKQTTRHDNQTVQVPNGSDEQGLCKMPYRYSSTVPP